MASGAEVDVSELERELKAIKHRVTDYSPIAPVLADILVGYVNEEFESAGRGRWSPLAPSTLLKRRGGSAQILKDTGRMAASIRAEYGSDWAAAVTDVSYAVFHVSDGARSKIPKRDFFDVEDAAWPDLVEVISDYISDNEG